MYALLTNDSVYKLELSLCDPLYIVLLSYVYYDYNIRGLANYIPTPRNIKIFNFITTVSCIIMIS